MALSFEAADRLFRSGEFARMIDGFGSDETEWAALDPPRRVLLAHSMAFTGNLRDSRRLAEMDRHDGVDGSVRSWAEWVLGLIEWRKGNIAAALQHAWTALRIATEAHD